MEASAPGWVHRTWLYLSCWTWNMQGFQKAAENQSHCLLSYLGCSHPLTVCPTVRAERSDPCAGLPCAHCLKNGVSIVPWCPEAAPQDQQSQGLWPGWAAHQQSWLHPPVTAPRIGPELCWNCHEKWKQSAPSIQSLWILSKIFQRFDTSWQLNRYFGNQNLWFLLV